MFIRRSPQHPNSNGLRCRLNVRKFVYELIDDSVMLSSGSPKLMASI